MISIVYDTETTSLIANSAMPLDKMPYTIELYCGKMELKEKDGEEEWELIDEIDFLIKPPYPITEEITKITNIDNDMVKDAPPMKDVFGRVIKFFEGADMVVAHNLTYDMGVFDNEAKRLGMDGFPNWPKDLVCTVEVSEPLFGRRMKLVDLHEELFGEPFKDAHRAKHDVQATMRCFNELWKRGEI